MTWTNRISKFPELESENISIVREEATRDRNVVLRLSFVPSRGTLSLSDTTAKSVRNSANSGSSNPLPVTKRLYYMLKHP